ncbi:cation:proton antiporter [Roseovarius salinarum]|uniref:cation:proton antiporter n=1 Tax=Roseovarius salinarum TaxID=1981892 RepID=UPI000C32BC73|nr:cation:proton antiporter [Roseovarius salinarum]
MADVADGAMAPVMAFALVGVLGVGAQWLAWRLRMPAIVLMLAAGLIVGPVTGLFDPRRDIGALLDPMIAVAVAIILFEGGLTLNFRSLRGAAEGVRRLVGVGAPLGWLGSALALHYVAGLGWAASAVFGGIMIVTGPTVIAPLLRQARLAHRPAQLLQWEAIVGDPIGALAAVLAFEVVLVLDAAETLGAAALDMGRGIVVAGLLGLLGGWCLAQAFRRALVPEYMKVPVLFALLLAVFAVSDAVLHESGLLAVTVMGIAVANADLPSFGELRRFKEHATVLLVSGVFILLAASMDLATLAALDWRAGAFVAVVVLLVRPVTVLGALLATRVPWRERWLVALTGPRGVVLVAVAGLFGERLLALGFADAERIAPLAFALVAATVLLHGFALRPLARALGLASAETPGVILVGGSQLAAALAETLRDLEVPALVADANRSRLRSAREAGLPVFFGDILSEAAEDHVELMSYGQVVAMSDNDAYNTLVATDLAPEFGRENVFQLKRAKHDSRRHELPATLGGRAIAGGEGYYELARRMAAGWQVCATPLSEGYGPDQWRADNPEAIALAEVSDRGGLRIIPEGDEPGDADGTHVVALVPDREAGAANGG